MVGLSHRSLWNPNLARLVQSADSKDVWRYIFDALQGDLGIGSLCVIQYMGETMPRALVNIADDDPSETRLSAYLQGAYLLDPFFLASLDQSLEGCYTLDDISSADFGNSEYYRKFFSVYGLEDEINLFCPLQRGSTVAVSLGREIGLRKFDATARTILIDCFPFVAEVVRQIAPRGEVWDLDARLRADFHARIVSAFKRMATSFLTEREKTIFDWLLRGYTVKATAERLGISDGTVRTHRHSIYRKLDVKSQTELFALVVEALLLVDPADNDDPLKRLEQPALTIHDGGRQ